MAPHLGHWTETIRNPKQMPKIAEKQNLKEHGFSFFWIYILKTKIFMCWWSHAGTILPN